MLKRYLEAQVRSDLMRKMVFLAGPRQSGKTNLSKKILGGSEGYLNWDASDDRELILKQQFPNSDLWVFDEIHKFRLWRNFLKGIYDKKKSTQRILVTGSAKLDLYRFGGDSLQGRYHFLRLHPLSFAELGLKANQRDLESLFQLSAFPEPFFEGSQKQANRWSLEYKRRLVREDISSLENLQDLTKVELLMNALPQRVGAPLSINSLREDLQVAHKSVARWLDVLEKVYSIFRIPPFGSPKMRAVKKEQKHYHLDWNLIEDEGPRFENLVANHLFKWVQFLEDTEGREIELRYFRDIDGREVDFVVVEKTKPILAMEVKLGDAPISSSLHYFHSKYPGCNLWQVHLRGKKDYTSPEGIRVAPASVFLAGLI